MNRKELETVVTCADCGSMAQAALALGVDRTSISRKISKVESDMGLDLFFVTPEGLVPTYAGEIYLRTARDILRIYDETVADVKAIARKREDC